MKQFFFMMLLSACCSYAFSQDTARRFTRTVTGRMPLDTNQIVYDEQGHVLHYYQYQRLLNSGQYTIRFNGVPNDPATKRYLQKLSSQTQNAMYERIKSMMVIKSPLLQEGNELDVKPLLGALNKTELDGKVVILIFWNTECPPCTESFADLSAIFKQIHNPEDVVVLAITPDVKNVAAAKLKEKPLLYAQLLSNAGSVLNYYQLQSYPSYVVADKSHIIRFAISGSSQITLPGFKSTIESVLNQ